MNKDYRMGFKDGYGMAMDTFGAAGRGVPDYDSDIYDEEDRMRAQDLMRAGIRRKPKRKVKQSKKQKLLTEMSKKKWNKYKKGSGKKTYVQIRAQVARSAEFKRKAKRLN
tara:strand:+ start:1122 stop:1451 length:330 start_codon:yes stop_codon:yes gene_type:complete